MAARDWQSGSFEFNKNPWAISLSIYGVFQMLRYWLDKYSDGLYSQGYRVVLNPPVKPIIINNPFAVRHGRLVIL